MNRSVQMVANIETEAINIYLLNFQLVTCRCSKIKPRNYWTRREYNGYRMHLPLYHWGRVFDLMEKSDRTREDILVCPLI